MTTYDPSKNRPARNPGGCECVACGAIFIGEEWHVECAVCHVSPVEKEVMERHARHIANQDPNADPF